MFEYGVIFRRILRTEKEGYSAAEREVIARFTFFLFGNGYLLSGEYFLDNSLKIFLSHTHER